MAIDKSFDGGNIGRTPNPSVVEIQNYHYFGVGEGVSALRSLKFKSNSSGGERLRLIPTWIGLG